MIVPANASADIGDAGETEAFRFVFAVRIRLGSVAQINAQVFKPSALFLYVSFATRNWFYS